MLSWWQKDRLNITIEFKKINTFNCSAGPMYFWIIN